MVLHLSPDQEARLARIASEAGSDAESLVYEAALRVIEEREFAAKTPLRSLEQDWVRAHRAEFAGQWVALEGAMLVAHGGSAREVLERARSTGEQRPLVIQIPTEPELPFGGW